MTQHEFINLLNKAETAKDIQNAIDTYMCKEKIRYI